MFLNLTLLFSINCDVFVLELRKSRQVPHPLGLHYGENNKLYFRSLSFKNNKHDILIE